MQRDFIVVVGMQGYGKSTWTELYGATKTRLLAYDPKGAFKNVDFLTDPEDWIPGVLDRTTKQFRFGTYIEEEISLFGNAAYAATNCTFIMEECATFFQRGGDVEKWMAPLIYMGREPQLNLVLVAQRAMSIPIGVRSQASRVVTFWQSEPDDVKALSDKIGKQYRDDILHLPFYTCLDWDHGKVSRYTVRP